MRCLNRRFVDRFGFPCGRCRACRMNKQSEKQLRIMHEGESYNDKVFVTLTYAPDFLPGKDKWLTGTLVKSDLQDFFKRFRRRLEPDQVRYFAGGEYGDKLGRAHYHVIFFGVSMDDQRVFRDLKYVPSKKIWYCDCPAWTLGHVSVAPVNEARAAYVAKYTLKKMSGEKSKEYYDGREPEFCLTSRGLGKEWCLAHLDRLVSENCVSVRGSKRPLPRYYIDQISKVMPSFRDKRKAFLQKWTEEKILNFLKNCPDFYRHGFNRDQFLKDKQDAYLRRVGKHIQMKGESVSAYED